MHYSQDEKWDLKEGIKQILGYKCYKASIRFGGRDWEAWYTLDIPYPDGPYKFSGLPGLIMEVSSYDGDYRFSVLGIQKASVTSIKKPWGIEWSSIQKEREFKEKIIRDPASLYREQMMQLSSRNMVVHASYNGKEITQKDMEQSLVQRFRDWMKTHNNPIEKGSLWIR